ncbi:lytic murein transglycosylase [Crossiella cryophila]|uniref:Membrane-bound lytic murein transglycosylase B n=1 Tax=Crossiella cryophila TaxID=43355 RepID=A0A7W7FRB2_9PSEU|nr:lytic murein transglycosylase [Crossiella cryophila]MBB4674168.1 membrane-bound lytic murein transglycosylase B [Crossiella cryophila]
MNADGHTRSERCWAFLLLGATGAALATLGAVVVRGELAATPALRQPPVAEFKLPAALAPPNAGAALPELTPQPPGARPQAQLAGWAAQYSNKLNVPKGALEAYGYAAALTAAERPACRITWTALAGIGQVESNHGRFNGARLDASARPTSDIRGIPLDGRPGVKAIRDTDGGRLDGDTVWDRAMGPLQFIPTTWQAWGADADTDGRTDPDDLDDAALSAARYLCASGGDLGTPEGWWRAVTTYNESRRYGQEVLDRADHYGRASREN